MFSNQIGTPKMLTTCSSSAHVFMIRVKAHNLEFAWGKDAALMDVYKSLFDKHLMAIMIARMMMLCVWLQAYSNKSTKTSRLHF